jgi:putative PEP-CTERM system TPR-repeat lipoprotein
MTFKKYKISIITIILMMVGCHKISFEEQLYNAEKDYMNSNYEAVIIQSKNLLREQPENKKARLLLAKSHYQLGSFMNSEKEFLKVIELGIELNLIANHYIKSLYGNDDFIGITNFWNKNLELLSSSQKAEIAPVVSIAYMLQKEIQKSVDVAMLGMTIAQEADNEKLIKINTSYANTFKRASDFTKKIKDLKSICETYPQEWFICNLLANAFYSEKMYIDAALVFEKILINKPKYNQLVFKLADSYVRANDYNSAQPYISSLLKAFPKQPYVNLLAASIAMNDEDYEQALNLINTTLNQNYRTPQALLIAGVINYQLKNFEQANILLQGLNSRYPNNSVISRLYIATQFKLGKTDNIYSSANQISDSKENSELLLQISSGLFKLGEKQEASDILDKIDTSLIENNKTLRSISLMKFKSGDKSGLKELEKALNQSIQNNADLDEINSYKLLLASSAAEIDGIEKAEQYIKAWIKSTPNDITNYQLLAELEKQKKPVSYDDLSEIYTKILNKDENDIPANIYFGGLSFKKADYKLAYHHYKMAIKAEKTNIMAIKGLYITSKNLNNQNETIKYIKSSLKDFKDNFMERLALSQFYLMLEQPTETITLLNEVVIPSGTFNLDRTIILGEAFLSTKQYKNAIKLYREALSQNIKNQTIVEKLLFAYEKSDDLNGAIDTFKELHYKHPDDIHIIITLTNLHLHAGQTDKSLALLKSLPLNQQENSIIIGMKGKALFFAGKYQKALEELIISYDNLPDSKTVQFIYSSYYKLNEKDKANTHMTTHLNRFPNDLDSRMYFANLLAQSDVEKSIEQYTYIIEKEDRNIISLNNLAWLLFNQGRLTEAKKYIDIATRYAPNDPDVIDTSIQINNAIKN